MVADVFMEIQERVTYGVIGGHCEYSTHIYINNRLTSLYFDGVYDV